MQDDDEGWPNGLHCTSLAGYGILVQCVCCTNLQLEKKDKIVSDARCHGGEPKKLLKRPLCSVILQYLLQLLRVVGSCT